MYPDNLSGLLNLGNSHYGKYDAEWLIVWVSVNDGKAEAIINPKENFEAKFEYYRNAYNEDLTLKANPNIKIVHYDMAVSLEDYFREL